MKWEENADGCAVLYKPKFKWDLFTRLMQRMGKDPNMKIHLDEYGSLVWLACDGDQSIWQICQTLQDHIQEPAESLPQRTMKFFQSLLGQNCIRFKELD
ncbi:PqqD family protein [candidate division KSB1 bacterium]|nr:PqqD family protein [candidate division KSB1 bacterium]